MIREALEIVEARADSDEVQGLFRELDAGLAANYPGGVIHGVKPQAGAERRLTMLVVRLDGVTVGCGGLREHDDGIGEVKRMFVKPAYRARGISRRVLFALEDLARSRGYARVRLETGTRQLEAIGLYESAGYGIIEPFGEYIGDLHSVCYEKALR